MRFEKYTIAYKNEIIALLSRCFGMSASESGIILEDALENGEYLLRFSDAALASVALYKDVCLRFGDSEKKGTYIFGLCTAAEYRGSGLASGLVREICENSDADYAVLIPESPYMFPFYEKQGFQPVGCAASFRVSAEKRVRVSRVDDVGKAYAAYRNAAEKYRDICLLSESDFKASAALSPQTFIIGDGGVCLVGEDVEAFGDAETVRDIAASALDLLGISGASVKTPTASAPDNAELLRIGVIKPLRGEQPPECFYINNLFNR